MKKIRVMIVEDSPAVRELLIHIINRDQRLEVAAVADSGERALQIINSVLPDVISMDIRLPGMTGLETTRKIMQIRPTPIVVVSASVEQEDLKISMNALKVGALSVVEKPVSISHEAYDRMADQICTQLAIMSEVKVVSQSLSVHRGILSSGLKTSVEPPVIRGRPEKAAEPYKWLGITASTGGPKALSVILEDLPRDFPLPVLVVQHISGSFHNGFVDWLDSVTPLSVVMVNNCEIAAPGKVYLPPADHHLVIRNGYVLPNDGPKICHQRPSGTVLFQSMAKQCGQSAIGVLLTGMGEDGAEGLKAIRDAGGYTIAEDKSTAVVYGMPAVAVGIGAVCESLPLDKIAHRILGLAAKTHNGRMNYANK